MAEKKYKFQNTKLSFEERVDDLVNNLTLDEKISQMVQSSPSIDRLGIPAYEWWNEALHGVARAGIATVFPQAIGLAAMFDSKLMLKIAKAISDEARAKHHKAIKEGIRQRYFGLTFWSPNINIFRDPRWGRGQETYGECPYLTSVLAVQFIKGMQGSDKKYLKTAACAKHFAVHSGPDNLRHSFDAVVSEKDLRETYLYAFENSVQAGVEIVMSAYNRVNGVPCSANRRLLETILRKEWGFKGHVVSDCMAISDIWKNHNYVKTQEEAVSVAIKAGCDLNCCIDECEEPRISIKRALASGLLSEEDINIAIKRLFLTRMRLGMFDPASKVKYSKIKYSVVDSTKHRALAHKASQESIVLLKNNQLLPLNKKKIKTIAVIGPNADELDVLLGNYCGTPSSPVTLLSGIKQKGIIVNYAKGCDLKSDNKDGFADAVKALKFAEAGIVCLGLSPKIEGEVCDVEGERQGLQLPGVQEELLKELRTLNKPIIVVLFGGGGLSFDLNLAEAILFAWYPGQSGGLAIADVIFGDYNPAGRLPVTFYKKVEDLPDFTNYSMDGRTYRYFKGEPLFPFGFGLSYTKFSYSNLRIGKKKLKQGETQTVTVTVKNIGKVAGDEVVQVYLKDVTASVRVPIRQLVGFQRINLKPGKKKTVKFKILPEQMMIYNEDGTREFEPGKFIISVGGCQPGFACETTQVRKASFVMV
jgi:beta-glucosidase